MARSWSRRYPKGLVARRANGSKAAVPTDFADRWRQAERGHGVPVAWLGHCTVLLRVGGLTILTDPVLSERIGLEVGPMSVGLPRHSPAPLGVGDLPTPDLVLISHAHFDHLDQPTLRALASHRTVVVTAAKTRGLIPRGFASVRQLPWDHAITIEAVGGQAGGVRLTALKPKHWGARTVWDRHRGYNSYLIETRDAHPARVLFAGDTAHTHAFDPLARIGGVDLAVMGIAAYDPWEKMHATPEQVWSMARAMRAARVLPVHHSTFALSDEPPDEPMARLLAAAGPERDRVLDARVGEIVTAFTPPAAAR